MNKIKNSYALAKTTLTTYGKKVNTFIDQYKIIKRIYYVGIGVNCYLSYQCLIKILALWEVEEHIETQLRRNLERNKELEKN